MICKHENCISLTSFNIPELVTDLAATCFYGCTSLASITLPPSVTNVGANCFVSADYLIYCCENIYDTMFETYGERVHLYDPAGIDETMTEAPSVLRTYDFNGRSVNVFQKVVVIRRYSDGTVRKVYVK